MSKAALYAINSTQQTLTGGGSVDLGNPVHGFGNTGCGCCQKAIDVSGNNLTIRENGMYGIIMSATVTASAAGTVTLQAFQDGTAFGVPMAVNIGAANEAASVTLNLGPRVCGASSIITLVATTTAGNVIIGGVSTLAWKL